MITQENQDWNRKAMDHINRRDDGWRADRILTHFTGGVLVIWSVMR